MADPGRVAHQQGVVAGPLARPAVARAGDRGRGRGIATRRDVPDPDVDLMVWVEITSRVGMRCGSSSGFGPGGCVS